VKIFRNTRQRTLVLEILRSGCVHLTADEVYRQARRRIPTVSLGTVYRNLNFLRHKGLVREIRSGENGIARFEAIRDQHAHFHCRNCGRVRDIRLPKELAAARWDEEGPIASVSSFDLNVIGDCSDCSRAAQEMETPA